MTLSNAGQKMPGTGIVPLLFRMFINLPFGLSLLLREEEESYLVLEMEALAFSNVIRHKKRDSAFRKKTME